MRVYTYYGLTEAKVNEVARVMSLQTGIYWTSDWAWPHGPFVITDKYDPGVDQTVSIWNLGSPSQN